MGEQVHLHFRRYDYAAFASFFTYAASSLVVPVALYQIAQDLNFSLENGGMGIGGLLEQGRSISMTVLLVLSGLIASRFGLRKTLGVSMIIMGIGCLIGALSGNAWCLFVSLLFAGSGEGYVEAAATPFVQKLHPKDTSQYMNFTHAFWSIGVAVTTILAGYLLQEGVSWRYVVGSVFALAIFPAVMLLLPEKKEYRIPESKSDGSAGQVLRRSAEIFKNPWFWVFYLLLFFSGGSEFCLTFWLASFLQTTMESSAFFGGLATAVFAFGMVVGRMGWGILVPQKKLGVSLIAAAVSGFVFVSALPFLRPDLAIGRNAVLAILFVLLFLIGITIAPLWPSLQTYAVQHLPDKLDETLIFIYLSAAGVPGCGFFVMIMGFVGDKAGGLDKAFLVVPFCQIVIVFLILAERMWNKNRGQSVLSDAKT